MDWLDSFMPCVNIPRKKSLQADRMTLWAGGRWIKNLSLLTVNSNADTEESMGQVKSVLHLCLQMRTGWLRIRRIEPSTFPLGAEPP